MKTTRMSIATAAILLTASTVMAQKIKVTDGSVDALKGISKMNVQYEYNNIEVGEKKEQDYISDKKKKYNDKEAGKGDKWEQDWKNDRAGKYQPKFEEQFNDQSDIKVGSFPQEKYTLILKTHALEPGYNVGVMKKNAMLDAEAWVVETANPAKVLVKFDVDDCPGRTFTGNDYDTGVRLQESYAVAGKYLAKYISKHL